MCHHTFELRASPEEYPTMLSEGVMNPKANREKTTEIMFETFNTPKFYLVGRAPLALYATGRATGLVVQSGATSTSVSPIYEGYTIRHAVYRKDVGGDHFTTYMMKLLMERGYSFTTTTEKEIVRDIKEKLCYVAPDFQTELKNNPDKDSTSTTVEKSYELPDGVVITIGNERFRCAEALFDSNFTYDLGMHVHMNKKPDTDWAGWKNNPSQVELLKNVWLSDKEKKTLFSKLPKDLITPVNRYAQPPPANGETMALHEMVDAAIRKCDWDLWKDLWGNITLSGGSTAFPGIADRLKQEVFNMAPDWAIVKLVQPYVKGTQSC